jgi:GNAT superfamily N-acetyltransferase
MMSIFEIRAAREADIGSAAELFDAYRQFYGQSADHALAEAFLRDRFAKNDSALFLAVDPQSGQALGFVHLYPSFSSVAARRIWILNDLFVAPAVRQRGIGRALFGSRPRLCSFHGGSKGRAFNSGHEPGSAGAVRIVRIQEG